MTLLAVLVEPVARLVLRHTQNEQMPTGASKAHRKHSILVVHKKSRNKEKSEKRADSQTSDYCRPKKEPVPTNLHDTTKQRTRKQDHSGHQRPNHRSSMPSAVSQDHTAIPESASKDTMKQAHTTRMHWIHTETGEHWQMHSIQQATKEPPEARLRASIPHHLPASVALRTDRPWRTPAERPAHTRKQHL